MGDEGRLFVAVDLGAGSGRVMLAGFRPQELMLEEVHRFHYPPRTEGGHLRWDIGRIFAEIKAGLRKAGGRAQELGRPIRSVGIDCWGVDYGLVDAAGRLLEDPVCYRDSRTDGMMEAAFERVPKAEIFARTGIQFMPFNTLFQVLAHLREGLPAEAARLLLVPDLLGFMLSGRQVTEYSIGTTTQMFEARAGTWDAGLLGRLGVPTRLLCEVVPSGTPLGALLPEVAAETGLHGVQVVVPAAHDTGSAVAGAPLQPGWAYISSGTWSLAGVELPGVLIDGEVARHNFTNEGGVYGTTRFLKNVMGLWILESCRREWREQGLPVDYDGLLRAAAAIEGEAGLVYPDDPRLLNPPSMLAALAEQLRETGQEVPSAPPAMVKVILDSLACRYASVFTTIEALTGAPVNGVRIIGGGCQNAYLNQATSTATGKPVLAGPVEATAMGNAIVQAIAAGRFASLAEARAHVARHVSPSSFEPRPTAASERAALRYAAIEARFTEGVRP
ncbi:MAG TPA: FGGY family carbohydrate kinase [Vicinamibacterales bacterium]|nr:FGGY family carbohydrate kinase [Vicinamibacterales bacterium]